MKGRIFYGCVLLVAAVLTGFLLLASKPSNFERPTSLPESETFEAAIQEPSQTEESAFEFDENVEEIEIDWNQCLDDISVTECIEAITPLIAAMRVLGDLSYLDLFERLDQNVSTVQKVVADRSCVPPEAGWSPYTEPYARCGAEAFAEIGRLLRGCFGYNQDYDPVWDLEESGVTDLALLSEAADLYSYKQAERAWLNAKCPSIRVDVTALPELYPVQDFPMSSDELLEKIAAEYIQRSAFLGDYRASLRLAESAAKVNAYLDMEKTEFGFWDSVTDGLVREDERERVAAVKQRDALLEGLIKRIVADDPLAGYQLLSDHEYHRFPDYEGHRPDEVDDTDAMIELANSHEEVMSGEKSPFYSPASAWEQRTFDMVKYQLVANRLAGRSEELHFAPAGAGKLKYISGMIDMYLDGNDLEYASQQAWEIVEQVRSKSSSGDE